MIIKKFFRIIIFCIFCFLFCLGNISNATVYTGNIPGETLQDQYAGYYYTYKIDKDLNFTTIYDDIEYPFLFYTYNGEGCSNGLRALQFFWNNGQIYAFGNYRDNTIFGQGYLKYMCKSDITDFQQYCLADGTDSNYSTDINELYETSISFNELYVDNLLTGNQNPSCYGGQLAVCFISESSNIVYCIKKSIARGFTDNLTQGNLISQYGVLPSDYQNAINNNVYGVSPIVGGVGGGGDIITNTGSITNFEAILGYNYTYGFNESYCYGGYPISDIFDSTDNPENFTGFELGSGAYIYDIYNAYSGSYFSSASQFYQSFYSRYLINNIASFYNYPKALYGIVERYAWLYDHYQTYDPNIGISKLVSYCELYKLDPDALYTGGDISAENGYSNLIGEITDKWRYYDSGPLSILSGENIKFGSDEFFTNILNKINTSLDNVSNNAVGVIPRYILVVLVALILFRIISH